MRKIIATLGLGFLLLLLGLSASASAGTPETVSVRLLDPLSSGSSQSGDTFTTTLASPLIVNDRIVAEKGARVTGQVREVVSSGRLNRAALIVLSLNTVQARSGRFPVQTGDLTIKAGSHATRNLLIIGGAAGAGAVIGGAAGGTKGTAIGALAGAGAGTIGAYLTGKREIVLPAETVLTFHVNSITISPQELARLQRAGQGAGSAQPSSDERWVDDTRSVTVLRRDHDDDEDDDDQGEDTPRRIEVVFLRDHRAGVEIYWPQRIERLTLRGDDLDDILEPLAARTRVSVELLRPRVRVKHED
jgi:hypothetical protein